MKQSEFRVGEVYYSPSGRMCMLKNAAGRGVGSNAYEFAYLRRDGQPYADEGFWLSHEAAEAISKMRPVSTYAVPVFGQP